LATDVLEGAHAREGHVHAWSRPALAAMLRSLERLAGAPTLVAETAAVDAGTPGAALMQEYRVAVGGAGADAAAFHRAWCDGANASYVTFQRHASPILLGGADVDGARVPAAAPPACKRLVRAVRTWEACAGAVTKAERRDCQRHAEKRARDHAAVSAARDKARDAS
jgi:hypothetical protein